MRLRALGNSPLQFTPIGLGTWAMGGDGWAFAWGPQDDRQSIAAVHQAIEQGVNWIDCAAVYGLGHAEEVLGRALKGRRDGVFIATKCGRIWDDQTRTIGKRITAESVQLEVEASLRRLRVDVIDLYQIHWPEPEEEIEEGWQAVANLIQAGKVRYGGVCNFNLAQLKRIHRHHPVTSLQPPYSLLNRQVETDLLPFCREERIGVLAYSPMQAGLLAGRMTRERIAALPDSDWRRQRSPYFQEPQLGINLQTVDRLKQVAQKRGGTVAQLSLAWVLRRPEITAAIVGARSPEQIEETIQAGTMELSPAVLGEIETILAEREDLLSSAR